MTDVSINIGELTAQEANRLVRQLEAVQDAARAFIDEGDLAGNLTLTFRQWEAWQRLRDAVRESDRWRP